MLADDSDERKMIDLDKARIRQALDQGLNTIFLFLSEGDTPGTHPVVLGAATAVAGVGEREACLVCCHGFVTGLLGAAQRLLSLGHSDVQRVLADLQSTIADAVEDSADRSLAELTPFAPLVDVLAADHERADRRLFLS